MTKKEQQKLLESFVRAIEPRVAKIREKIIYTYVADIKGQSPFAIKILPVLGHGIEIDLKSCYSKRLYSAGEEKFSEGRVHLYLKHAVGARSQVLQKLIKEFDEAEKWFYAAYITWEKLNAEEGNIGTNKTL